MNNHPSKQDLINTFSTIYGHQPTHLFFAPGRVNLIGEHTDYNGGYVFPCALSFGTYLLLAPNAAQRLRFRSLNIQEDSPYELPINQPITPVQSSPQRNPWVNYPLGCIAQFVKRGFRLTQGYDLLFSGDVPAGAGLSSSAAIEVVTAVAFNTLLNASYDLTELAKIGQLSEHEFAGVNCGIMDQFASAHGQKDHAIFLNCDTLDYRLVPVRLDGIKVVIANTHSPHKLDSGAYNARVAQCQLALRQLQTVRPTLHNLAELTLADWQQVCHAITDEVAFRRARHVVTEVQRTQEAVSALQQGDIQHFGTLMNQSHLSLRDDYEVTGLELDALAEAAWQQAGVIGSRMTGGGFGGCTVSLVQEAAIPDFITQVGHRYTQSTGLTAAFYIAEIADGAHIINL